MTGPAMSGGHSSSDGELVKLRGDLIELLARELESASLPLEEHAGFVTRRLDELLATLALPEAAHAQVRRHVLDEFVGYGPIQSLIEDPQVTEVMVNAADNVYVEKGGRLEKTSIVFENHAHIRRIIDRIVLPLGRRISKSSPTVDARLPDGSRFNAVVPPVGIDGPTFTIRKFPKDKLTIQALIEYGSLTTAMSEFLRACVVCRLNIVVSGGTGSGKTTLLNVLSRFIPETERIVTIEDSAELQLQHDNLVRLETKAPDSDEDKAVTVRDLVRNSLRMRPDRIVVGECRGGETLDMLQAMNSGHDGSLTTIHANTPRDAIARLETMVLMAGIDFPIKVVRQHISSAVDVIVQQSRLKDGSRKITSITEVAGMEGEVVVMNEVFCFEQTGAASDSKVTGQLRPTGIRPHFTSRLEQGGFKLPPELFGGGVTDRPRRW